MDADRDEDTLIAQACRGDRQAFGLLIRRLEPAVAAVSIAMLGHDGDAEDAGQETMIRLFHALPAFRGQSSLRTFTTRIAVNIALDMLRRRRREAHGRQAFEHRTAAPAEPSVDPRGRLDRQRRIRTALQVLSPEHRAVIVLRLILGHSTAETADLLSLPEGTVLSRLSRARATLATSLKEMLDD